MSADIEGKAHARLSSSGAYRWTACPGSIAMEEAVPKELRRGSTVFAAEGTAAHAMLEVCLKKNVRPDHPDVAGRWIKVFDDGGTSILKKGAKIDVARGDMQADGARLFDVDEEMVEALTVVWDYVHERLEAVEKEYGDKPEMRIEVKGPYLQTRDDAFGTADVTIDLWPFYLEVVDLKYGKGVQVSPVGNLQFRNYVLVADREQFCYERYRTTVAQPRAPLGGVTNQDGADWNALGIAWEEIDAVELERHRDFVVERAQRVDEADRWFEGDPFKDIDLLAMGGPDESKLWHEVFLNADHGHCGFCEARYNGCPAHEAIGKKYIEEDFPDDAGNMRPLSELDPAQIAERARLAPLLELMARSYREAAFRAIGAGVDVPGMKIVRSKGKRAYRESVTVGEVLDHAIEYLENLGVDTTLLMEDDVLTEPELLSPTKLEMKLASKFAPRGKKGIVKKEVLNNVTVNPAGKLKLVEDTAPGEAVRVSIDDDFDDDDDEEEAME